MNQKENKFVLKRLGEIKGARLVFVQTLFLNLLVALSKLVCGIATHTLSMVADGFHSLLDSLSNVIGIVGLTISLEPPDEGHPYGHRKFEAVAAIGISFLMFFAGFHVISDVIERLTAENPEVPEVGLVSYLVIAFSMIINIFVTIYQKKKAKELQSTLLEADSEHTLSDIFVSLGVVIALISAQFQLFVIDVVASIIIVIAIVKAGYGIVSSQFGTLVDAVVLDPGDIEEIVLQTPGVVSCHKIRTRGMKDHVFLDLHVQVPGHLSVKEGHGIAYEVEDKLKSHSSGIVDVVVHIEEVVEEKENKSD